MNIEKKSNTNTAKIEEKSDFFDDSDLQFLCGEDLFQELCETSIKYWLETHQEEIMEKIVDGYNLQPRKKKSKVTKDIK